MSATIEVQAPASRSLRGYMWGLVALLFVLAALLIWNLTSGQGTTATKIGGNAPVTKTVERTQTGLVNTGGESHPRPFEGIVAPATAGGGTEAASGRGAAISPQQR